MSDLKKLELTNDDLVVINDALMQMPYYRVQPLIFKINDQLQAQIAPPTSGEKLSTKVAREAAKNHA